MKIKLSILLFFICVLTVSKAQTVDFNYTTANGLYCNPQIVTFTQNCTPAPINYIWSFGNGQSGDKATESITYSTAGTYTVKLTAVYPTTAITTTKTIVINPSPTISLTANKNNLCQPGNVIFTAPGSNFITSYEWDFGDGSPVVTTANNSINHAYTTYNYFRATVKGITANGCSASANYNVTVAKFTISGSVTPSNGCIPANSLLSVTADLPAGDAAQNFLWNFGDGSPTVSGTVNSISHLYNTTTTISNANVTITSAQGCTNQFTFPPFAFGTPPFATDARTVSGRTTFCGSETIQLYGKATNANLYNWDFGDGTNASVTDTLLSHKFRSLGNKRIVLTPYFNGCEGLKDTINVFIEGVIADFAISNTCTNKNTFLFTNNSLGNVDHFEWTFSDTPSVIDSTNYNATHTFPVAGNYSSHLFLIDSITGCIDSLTKQLYTAIPVFNRSNSTVCKDSLVTYSVVNSYPPGSGFTYEFHVNGLIVDNGGSTVLNYYPAVHGNFTEYVVIKDTLSGTCNDSLFLSGQTRVQGPVVNFTAAAGICADTSLVLTNNSYPFFSADSIIKWNWDFGDNKKDSIRNPSPHSYVLPGNYAITLTATDINGCKQKLVKPVTVFPVPKISVFPAIDTICQRDTALLTAFTVDSIMWSPATNIDCINCDTVKVYPNSTTLYIARAMNSAGCKSYDSALVKVFQPFNLVVSPADTTICPGQTIRYNTNTGGITVWSPSTFLNNNKIRNPIARPTTALTYTVTVVDSVGCFADTAFAVVNMFPSPTVNAGPDKILPYYSSFNISPAYSSDIVQYSWTPSTDLDCSTCPSPSGIALRSESYKIEVQNNFGCKAADTIRIFINCLNANLLMPNAFTPNRDGKNDYFYPITRGYRIVKYFVIFNRYGQKVFERKNFDPNIATLGWDGRIKDNKYGTTEVFSWFMEAECDLGALMNTKGTVVLIR